MTANELIKLGNFRRAIEIAKDKAQENLDHLIEVEEAYDKLVYELIDANRQERKDPPGFEGTWEKLDNLGSIREAFDESV